MLHKKLPKYLHCIKSNINFESFERERALCAIASPIRLDSTKQPIDSAVLCCFMKRLLYNRLGLGIALHLEKEKSLFYLWY